MFTLMMEVGTLMGAVFSGIILLIGDYELVFLAAMLFGALGTVVSIYF